MAHRYGRAGIGFRTLFLTTCAVLVAARGLVRADTYLILKSQPGDYVGGGRTLTLTPDDGTFGITGSPNGVDILFNGSTHFWDLDFAAPSNTVLAVGAYENATRFPFNSPTKPGLSVDGDGAGCNELTGRFEILELVTDSSDDVQRFAADFEQHCEGGEPALFGVVRYNSDVAADAPPPTPVPPTPTPSSYDTFFALNSEPGDFIGLGVQQLLTIADGVFTAQHEVGHVGIGFQGDTFWTADFAAPGGVELVPGVYERATRYPFQAADEPGLDFSGDGRGCNELTGRFVVLEGVYGASGDVEHFAADFEQHCEGGAAALFGSVRFHSTAPTITPRPSLTPTPTGTRTPTPTPRHTATVTRTGTITQTPTVTLTPTPSVTSTPCVHEDLGSILPISVVGTTIGGTNGFSSVCGGANAPERVYTFTAPADGQYVIDTSGSALDTILSIRDGACGGFELTCNDDWIVPDTSSQVTLLLRRAQMIEIDVGGFAAAGSFSLRITQPPPSCAAGTLTAAATVTGSTAGAADVNSGTCGGLGSGDQVFAFTAPTYGTYTFSTEGSDFDTVLYVRDGDCLGYELACNDDAGPATATSEASISLQAGQLVLVFVDGFGGASGNFSLHVTGSDLPACPETDLGMSLPVSTAGSTVGAAEAPQDACGNHGAARSFRFSAPSDGFYLVSAEAATSASAVTVLDGDCSGAVLGCGAGVVAQTAVALTTGQMVAVLVRTDEGVGGKFALQIEQPAATQSPTPVPTVPTSTPAACPEADLSGPLPIAVSGMVWNSAPSVMEGSCGGNGAEHAFRYTAPTDDTYVFSTAGSNYPTVLYVRDGDCSGPELACNASGFPVAQLTLPLAAGQSVIVVVDAAYPGIFGKFALQIDRYVSTPTTTATQTATPAICPETDLGDALPTMADGSTTDGPDYGRGSCGSDMIPQRSFRYTAPVTGFYTFDTDGSALDTVLYVRDRSCSGPELACNDDAVGLGTASRVTLSLTAGEPVIVFVGGFSDSGDFTLHVNPGVSPTATPTPASTPSPGQSCVGDCADDHQVTVDDLIKGVNIALGNAVAGTCPAFDCHGSGQVTVDCLVRGVGAALDGCAGA
jgi:hypothetical protein